MSGIRTDYLKVGAVSEVPEVPDVNVLEHVSRSSRRIDSAAGHAGIAGRQRLKPPPATGNRLKPVDMADINARAMAPEKSGTPPSDPF